MHRHGTSNRFRSLGIWPPCRVYPATLPPETKLLPLEKYHQLPPLGGTCFDDQLTRPLHTNLLLQHETEDIHTTEKWKQWAIMSINTTVEHCVNVFVYKGGKLEKRQFLPKCTRLHQIVSQISKFSRGWFPGSPSLGRGTPPSQTPPPPARLFAPRLVAVYTESCKGRNPLGKLFGN